MANGNAAAGSKLVEFRKSHPIDFSLLDKDDQAVMYISEDTDDRALHLTIANTSSQPITMADGPDKESSSANHHFALRFRPGTLSTRTLTLLADQQGVKTVVQTPGWQLARLPAQPAPNAPVTLYLLHTGADQELAKSDDENGTRRIDTRGIELSGISAAPGSGARGTQVELIPNPARVKYKSDQSGITGSRTQYLHVTNHSGRKNIPLHVGFVGGNRVLAGELGTLKLRITNVLYKPKDLSKPPVITFQGGGAIKTKLVLSYDAGEDDWSLARKGALHVDPPQQSAPPASTAMKEVLPVAAVTPPPNTTLVPFTEGDTPEWAITFNQDFSLQPRESFDITVADLPVSPTPGNANLYLRYENIPGYWDGQFVCTVEKGPIVVKGGNVGIGMTPTTATGTTPTPKLEVAGETKTTTLSVTDASTLGTLTVAGKAAAPRNTAGAGTIQLGSGKLELGWQDGQSPKPGQGWIQTQEGKHLALNPVGDNRVGIGTMEPTAKLEVAGDVRMDFSSQCGLVFQANNQNDPGVFAVGAKNPDGTYQPCKSLTIASGFVNAAGERPPLPELNIAASNVNVMGTLDAHGLTVKGAISGFRPVDFREATFYFIGRNPPDSNGMLVGRTADRDIAAQSLEIKFDQPVAAVTSFVAEYHLEFLDGTTPYERPLGLIGVGVNAVVNKDNPKEVIVTASATLRDKRQDDGEHFQGSARVVILVFFAHAL